MQYLARIFSDIVRQYQLRTGDMDLARAQFREFVHQVPLMYFVLSCNAVVITLFFTPSAGLWLATVPAFALCTIATLRGFWWSRLRHVNFSDANIRRQIETTGKLAIILAGAYMIWGMLLYPHGTSDQKNLLIFCLALAQTCTVSCLMPLRSAALWTATVSGTVFCSLCIFIDDGIYIPHGFILALSSVAAVVTLYRHHRTFGALISSQLSLRQRQIETEKLSDENRRTAFTDALSGLPNRRALVARLEELSAETQPEPDLLAVAFLDLDGFKIVNDVHGHQLGDTLIGRISLLLQTIVPPDAMLVRVGGDEFALLAEGRGAGAKVEAFARQAIELASTPMKINGIQISIGASIGFATDDTGTVQPFELLRRADTAMYCVKANGKGGIQSYDSGLDAERVWRRQVEQEISSGLMNAEFSVVYQPIVDAADSHITAVEALVRWPGRPAGPLTPDEFIGIAESSGSIQALGMFVLERSCREIRPFGTLRLSVNVSPSQFSHPDFVRQVLSILDLTGFPPERLQFEITERNLIDHPERAKLAIDALQERGIRFALDDFGTGFTSLAYLQSYGFSCVKIDRSLIKRLEEGTKAIYLVSGLVQMAKGLDVKVVAEGIESEHLAHLVRAAGCSELQGYHFGRPEGIDMLKESITAKGMPASNAGDLQPLRVAS